MRKAIWVLWPSFLIAGAAETVFFTLFDPMELHLFGEPTDLSRIAVYSGGSNASAAGSMSPSIRGS